MKSLWTPFLLTIVISSPLLNPVQTRQLSSEPEGLYNSNDDVIVLDKSNLTSVLESSEQNWLIEFYSSWCGHCVHFAPTYKQVAKAVKGWSQVLRVGAIDCASDHNIGTCRDYEVMGYPSMRFFGPHASKDDLGKAYESSKEVDAIVAAAVTHIRAVQSANTFDNWPNLDPVHNLQALNSGSKILVMVSKDALHVDLDARLILDVHGRVHDQQLLMHVAHNEDVENDLKTLLDLDPSDSDWPKVVLVQRGSDGSFEKVDQRALNKRQGRDEKVEAILVMLDIKDDNNIKSIKKDNKEKSANAELASSKVETRLEVIKHRRYTVFMADLEKAVIYALQHEVAQHSSISGAALRALKDFVEVLNKFFPARPAFHRFLQSLGEYVASTSNTLHGEQVSSQVSHLLNLHSINVNAEWIGCRGSSSKYGNFPCALWTLFHTLTLGQLEHDRKSLVKKHVRDEPYKVMVAVTQYVKEFFGCRQCSEHFLAMATKQSSVDFRANFFESIKSAEDQVLWLWAAHNRVNRRLSGDLMDDPVFPKQIFPSKEMCYKCYKENSNNNEDDEDNFEQDIIVDFLYNKMYGKDVISREGLSFSLGDVDEQHQLVVVNDERDLNSNQMRPNPSMNLLSSADWRLCLMLYFVSSAIIIGVFVRFGGRRRLVGCLRRALQQRSNKAFSAMV